MIQFVWWSANCGRSLVKRSGFLRFLQPSSIIAILLVSIVAAGSGWGQAAAAQRSLDYVRLVRYIETGRMGYPDPTGLAFLSKSDGLFVLGPARVAANVFKLAPVDDSSESVRIPEAIEDPLNLTYDSKTDRLLILQRETNELIEIPAGSDGVLRTVAFRRIDAGHFGVSDPQGMTVDPQSGNLFILDVVWSRILRIEPDPVSGFEQATVSEIDLQSSGLGEFDLRGIAFDPTTSHLHLLDPNMLRLYEVTDTGVVVANRDVSDFGLRNPQGMVFAPSGDLTDDPSNMSLYIANSGDHASATSSGKGSGVVGGISELSVAR